MNILNTDGNQIESQILRYRELLSTAISVEEDKTRLNQFIRYAKTLDKIEIAYKDNNKGELNNLLENESRSFGWGWQDTKYGAEVEESFWILEKLIRNIQ